MKLEQGDKATDWTILIYPYWNVDQTKSSIQTERAMILIYPYWNVDNSSFYYTRFVFDILIYPYWNVDKSTKLSIL